MMDRRAFVATLTSGLLTAPLAAEAQQARQVRSRRHWSSRRVRGKVLTRPLTQGGGLPLVRRALVLAVLVLAGCSHAALPYKPDPQPRGAKLSAAYTVVGDRLGIELDTSGHPLEQAWIIKPDGTSVAAQSVDMPPLVTRPGPSIGIGVGGASYGHGVGVGSGVGVGVPVGSDSTRMAGNTTVWFPLASAGEAPWQLYVKVAGAEAATFYVGGPLRE